MDQAAQVQEFESLQYAGFWLRVVAAVVDSVLLLAIVLPILLIIGGSAYGLGGGSGLVYVLANYVLPAGAVMAFWAYKSATPGKIILGMKIVDAKTLGKLSGGQILGRYLGYYVSTIPLFLGLIWVGFDKQKQGWHDKLAGTLVIMNEPKEK